MNPRPSMPTSFNAILDVVSVDLVQQLEHENAYHRFE